MPVYRDPHASANVGERALEAEGSIASMADDPNYRNYSIYGYGAHFAEVGVDADTAEVRLRRMLGVFSAGRRFAVTGRVNRRRARRAHRVGAATLRLAVRGHI
jgi:CO/xanthine dehydrogenase Mo-binding subunit